MNHKEKIRKTYCRNKCTCFQQIWISSSFWVFPIILINLTWLSSPRGKENRRENKSREIIVKQMVCSAFWERFILLSISPWGFCLFVCLFFTAVLVSMKNQCYWVLYLFQTSWKTETPPCNCHRYLNAYFKTSKNKWLVCINLVCSEQKRKLHTPPSLKGFTYWLFQGNFELNLWKSLWGLKSSHMHKKSAFSKYWESWHFWYRNIPPVTVLTIGHIKGKQRQNN